VGKYDGSFRQILSTGAQLRFDAAIGGGSGGAVGSAVLRRQASLQSHVQRPLVGSRGNVWPCFTQADADRGMRPSIG
jgi:hypothetical protein